jgi:hypothetical protein
MTDMQTSLPLLIVRPSILNPVIHFSTQPLIGEIKCPRLYLCLVHSIPSPPILMQHMHQPITNDMIHFISSHDHIGSLILTSLVLHHCFGPLVPSYHLTCPLHLQPVLEPSLILIFSTLVTWLNVMSHMQWAPLSHVWALQQIQAISPPWHRLLTHDVLMD